MTYVVRNVDDVDFSPARFGDALREKTLLSGADGSVHLEIAIAELSPGGRIDGHLHPFEESFYLLSGAALVALDGRRYRLRQGDFGFAPVRTPHAWSNPHDEPAVWLRVRSPQPRRIGEGHGTYRFADLAPPSDGRRVSEQDPVTRFVGHFSEEDLGPPGPLSMPGYHGHNVRDVSIRMMVDSVLGAEHHTLFTVQFAPRPDARDLVAKEHFHPFEEIYFLVAGQARGRLDGRQHDVTAGDLIWMPTNVSHGFVNTGEVPVRWLEVQAPAPPPSNGFFFEDDWKALDHA